MSKRQDQLTFRRKEGGPTMTIEEVARFFRVSTKTIYNWMRYDPDFPRGFKKFGTRRFLASEIRRYWSDNPYTSPEESWEREEGAFPK